MKYTQYFLHTRERDDRKRIKSEWIERTVQSPVRREMQTDGRLRLWTYITEESKYLRVILLSDGETVHNAFFDRSFREDKK
jgi:predicted ATPase